MEQLLDSVFETFVLFIKTFEAIFRNQLNILTEFLNFLLTFFLLSHLSSVFEHACVIVVYQPS
jgi:hypothetical protein